MFRNFVNLPNDLPQAGRLKHFLAAWEQITKDPWVLQVVSGYQIEFLANPVQRNTPPPISCSLEHQTLIDQEVWEVIKRGSPFRSTRFSTGTRIHQFSFCNTQKGWGPQASDKFKPLNCFIPYEHSKMESIHMLKDLLKRGITW